MRTLRRVLYDTQRSIEINMILNRCATLAYMISETYYEKITDRVATVAIAVLNDIVDKTSRKDFVLPNNRDLSYSRLALSSLCRDITTHRKIVLNDVSRLNRIRHTLTRFPSR